MKKHDEEKQVQVCDEMLDNFTLTDKMSFNKIR